jgi:hypothetical protein
VRIGVVGGLEVAMDDTDQQSRWRRELERRGATSVRDALSEDRDIPNVDRAFARQWIIEHDMRFLPSLLFWARVRTAMLAVAAIAAILMAIEFLLERL